jgi:hypothetical protein
MKENPDSFYLQLGRAIAGWSIMESAYCGFFAKVTQMHPPMARRIFYSTVGFRARTKMLRLAMDSVNFSEPEMREFWQDSIDKSEKYAKFRNELAHGDVVNIAFEGSRYNGQTIIIQGREFWKADPNPSEVITLEDIKRGDANIRRLAAALVFVLGRDPTKPGPGQKECRELVRLLPSVATSNQLTEEQIAKFSVIYSVGFER